MSEKSSSRVQLGEKSHTRQFSKVSGCSIAMHTSYMIINFYFKICTIKLSTMLQIRIINDGNLPASHYAFTKRSKILSKISQAVKNCGLLLRKIQGGHQEMAVVVG